MCDSSRDSGHHTFAEEDAELAADAAEAAAVAAREGPPVVRGLGENRLFGKQVQVEVVGMVLRKSHSVKRPEPVGDKHQDLGGITKVQRRTTKGLRHNAPGCLIQVS